MLNTVPIFGTVIAKTGPHRGSYSGLYAPDPRAKTRVARMDE